MQRSSIVSKRTSLSLAAILCLFAAALGIFAVASNVSAARASDYVALNKSFIQAPATAALQGQHASNAQMTISLVLQPNNSTNLNNLLNALYTPGNPLYHHWLATGQFNQLFSPTKAQTQQVTDFVQKGGLKLTASPSPFIVRATGTTAQVEALFHTTVNNYKAASGQAFYQNDSSIQVPASLSSVVSTVTGLSNTSKPHPNLIRTASAAKAQGKRTPKYGAGPNGSGLVPSQIESLYDANGAYKLGARGQGKNATLAVFELSGYTETDPQVYQRNFFGRSLYVPVVDVNVDGGPLSPVCPTGDTCNPGPDYSGDVEVVADIEMQMAIAPQANKILVYNAPNDQNGETIVDEYMQIANDNTADSISSSWGLCELDAGFAQAKAESVAFEQMAAQGQSMFSAAGDTGAYDCLRGSGNTSLSVDDPSSQPFVTAVGGTSFESYDPGTNLYPSYQSETVWNVLNACRTTNLSACANSGAGGGGVSSFWAQPDYQHGPGVISNYSQTAPYCSQAKSGQYCRQVPDVSANADEYSPYAEYCTGSTSTNSQCTPPAYGWFGIGGTSLASPLWSGVIALWDSVHGKRFGNANYGLYQMFRSSDAYSKYFHDITGKNQTENNNGFYPTTPNYDIATGIGSPRITNFVLANN
jgi:kumamolisin